MATYESVIDLEDAMTCSACGSVMDADAKFCSVCGTPVAASGYAGYVPVPPTAARGQLVRPFDGRVIAGVCAGVAQHYGWDPVLVRLVWCGSVLLGFAPSILAYVIAWIVIPEGQYFVPTAVVPVAAPIVPPAPVSEPVVMQSGETGL